MREQHQQRITELFEAALREAPSQRADFLRRACADDEALLIEVKSLVAEHELSEDFKAAPTARKPSASEFGALMQALVAPTAPLEDPGTVIGPYEILGRIGEGGMGVVFKAQQVRPVRRLVALKVVKPGMDTKEVITRFEGERQALATMSHPNIAQFFDAGATAAERPYFVMELVDGLPITRYCDAHRLTIRERIELFIPVCLAIQHAHQRGIIHRDIKPSNLLVTQQDGRGVPKVIDFGIAKATGQRLAADATISTHLGTVVGTLDYMSPEQADLVAHDIDTRSDIYSLGAVLYELLAGTTPLDIGSSKTTSYLQALERIRGQEPPPPSAAVQRLGKSLAEISEQRRSGAGQLPRLLHRELDWIVMKALEKDRTRRYETVSVLISDLEGYLSGEPVNAGPPSATYRMRKLGRKYRLWLASGLVFAVLLLTGTVVSTWMAVRADKANQEAQAVISFLQKDLLEQASPNKRAESGQTPDPDLRVRTLLDRAASRIVGQFDSQPLVEATIRSTIGDTYVDLGVYPQAVEQLDRALKLRRRVLGPTNPETLNLANGLGLAYRMEGKYPEAEMLFSQTLEIAKRKLGAAHRDTLSIMDNLGEVYEDQGKYPESEALLSKVLEVRRRVLGHEDGDTVEAMNNLAGLYEQQGKFPQAEALDVQVVEIQRHTLGAEHPHTLTSMNNLAYVYFDKGEYPKAERLFEQALDIQRRVMGRDHRDTATTMHNLAAAYTADGKYPQAEALDTQVLEIFRRVLGPEHSDTITSMMSLAVDYWMDGQYPQAEALDQKILEIQRRVMGPEHRNTLLTMNTLGVVLLYEGKYAQAEALLAQVAELEKHVLGPEHPDTLTTLSNLAEARRGHGEYQVAEALFRQVVDTERRVLGAEHPDVLRAMHHMAQIYQAQGEDQEAATLFSKVLEIQRRVLGADHPETLRTMSSLASTYQSQGKDVQAELLLRQGFAVYESKMPDNWERFRCQSLLGTSLEAQGKYAEAETLLLSGYEGMVQQKARIPASSQFNLDLAGEAIMRLYKTWGKQEKAEQWQEKFHKKPTGTHERQ